mmetsp:Transcript_62452/g.186065  ORF Transcript_62452/g.186065 Transcript_62452/m.186065 type:complete len:290 (-) Transcript_62452:411-1280(-)
MHHGKEDRHETELGNRLVEDPLALPGKLGPEERELHHRDHRGEGCAGQEDHPHLLEDAQQLRGLPLSQRTDEARERLEGPCVDDRGGRHPWQRDRGEEGLFQGEVEPAGEDGPRDAALGEEERRERAEGKLGPSARRLAHDSGAERGHEDSPPEEDKLEHGGHARDGAQKVAAVAGGVPVPVLHPRRDAFCDAETAGSCNVMVDVEEPRPSVARHADQPDEEYDCVQHRKATRGVHRVELVAGEVAVGALDFDLAADCRLAERAAVRDGEDVVPRLVDRERPDLRGHLS